MAQRILCTRIGRGVFMGVAMVCGNRWLLPRLEELHTLFAGLKIKPILPFDLVNFGALVLASSPV